MYAEQLRAHYREIEYRLRPPPPRRPRCTFAPSPVPDTPPRFVARYWHKEHHITPFIVPTSVPMARKIIDTVVALSGLSQAALLGAGRSAEIIPYRHLMQMVIRDVTGLSYPRIAEYVGGKDHTTILNAARRGRILVEQPKWARFHDEVLRTISNTPSYVLSARL